MLNVQDATKEELIKEYDEVSGDLWSKYSCDCLGFYLSALHKRIVELGGWL